MKNFFSFERKLVLISILCFFAMVYLSKEPQAQNVTTQNPAASTKSLRQKVADLSSTIIQLKNETNKLSQELNETKKKLDEAGWKALDFSTKLSGVQWQILAIVFSINAIFFSLLNYGLFQSLKHKLDEIVKVVVDKEHMRLQQSLSDAENNLMNKVNQHIDNSLHDLREQVDIGQIRIQAGSLSYIGLTFWRQYESVQYDGAATQNEKERNLETAISLTCSAIQGIDKLDKNSTENEKLIASVKSNAAYYLVERDKGENDKALKLAKEAFSIAIKYRESIKNDILWGEYLESSCWVFWRIGDAQDKMQTKLLIEDLCNDREISFPWRSHNYRKYFQNDLAK